MKKITSRLVAIVCLLVLIVTMAAGCGAVSVTYDFNYEGSKSTKVSQSVSEKITLIDNPTREGYVFEGWFLDKECTNAFADEKIDKSITLYAKWSEAVAQVDYYLGTSLNGYAVPNSDAKYKLELVPNSSTLYFITVDFKKELRDPTYDGHWYKISKGTWNASECYGSDNYFIQPAPAKYTTGDNPTQIGLGSIWIDKDGLVTIMFDSETNTIYDTSKGDFSWKFAKPVIYGDFNNWNIHDTKTAMTKNADSDTYSVSITLPAYTGEGKGWTLLTCVSGKFYEQWSSFGANEQYVFDGSAAAMGSATFIKNDVETTYTFTFDPKTNKTSCDKDFTYALAGPTLYGDFNNWNLNDANTTMTKTAGQNTYSVTVTLPAYKGEGNGWSFINCVSGKYFSEWNSFGAGEQYVLDGSVAAMGSATYIKNNVETTYVFTYDPTTHITTYVVK